MTRGFVRYFWVLVVFVEVLSTVIYACRYFMLFIKFLASICVVALVGFSFGVFRVLVKVKNF